MNIQKIFEAVEADEMNSPLHSIIYELEKQNYMVRLEGLDVTAEEMEARLFEDLERATNEFEIEIISNSEPAQKFKIVFTDYHKFNLQAC